MKPSPRVGEKLEILCDRDHVLVVVPFPSDTKVAKDFSAEMADSSGFFTSVGIASWVLFQRHNESLVAQTTVLDLRSRSVSRSPEPIPGEQPLELRRGFSQLNIYLPLGSPEAPMKSAL